MHLPLKLLAALLLLATSALAQTTIVATFDDLPTAPDLDKFRYFQDANSGGSVYRGITWHPSWVVVGREYHEAWANNGGTNPFAIPFSNDYALFNASGADHLTFTNPTGYTLAGGWFGRISLGQGVQGTNQITIHALASNHTILGSVTINLSSYANLSAFANLSNISSYQIDRVPLGYDPGAGGDAYGGVHYVMDHLTFTAIAPAAIPEPSTYALLAGAAALGLAWRARPRRS